MENLKLVTYGFQPIKRFCELTGLKPHWARDLRLQGKLISGVHYSKCPGIRGFLYNVELLQDFVQCGGDPALHQQAIDKFLATQNVPRRVARNRRGAVA